MNDNSKYKKIPKEWGSKARKEEPIRPRFKEYTRKEIEQEIAMMEKKIKELEND